MNYFISFFTCLFFGLSVFAQTPNYLPLNPITLQKGHFSEEEILHQIKTNVKLYQATDIQTTNEFIKACNAQTEKEIIKIQQQIWAIRKQKRNIHTIEAQQDKRPQKKELKKYLHKTKIIAFDENKVEFILDSILKYWDKQLAEKSEQWNKTSENFLFEKTILIPHFQGDTSTVWAENVKFLFTQLQNEYAVIGKRLEFTELKELSDLQIHGYAETELQREIKQIWVYFYEGGLQNVLKVVAKCAVIPNENLNYEGSQNEIIQDSFQNYREHKLGNLDMIAVKGGSFWVENENLLVQTELSDFYIGKTEITVAQYRLFCEAKNKELPNPPSYGWKDNHPITNISWNDALAFCEWLSQISGKTYTLPTEQQWEFAAKGGLLSNNYKYSGGNELEEVAWHYENAGFKTHLVASKKPNELGIYDMTGNVWEWCLDDYKPMFYNSLRNPNKEIMKFENASYKVMRGMSAWDMKNSHEWNARLVGMSIETNCGMGFRVCGVRARK